MAPAIPACPMINKLKIVILILFAALLQTACAEMPNSESSQPAPSVATPPAATAAPGAVAPAATQQAQAEIVVPKTPVLPKIDLDERTVYEFLLAEISGQRGNVGLSVLTYIELARRTRDPRIAKRATEIAVFSRNNDAGVEAATIWVETDPDSMQAEQALTGLLVNSNQLELVKPHLVRLLAADNDGRQDSLMQLPRLLARVPDRTAVLGLTLEVVKPYASMPEAHFAVAQTAVSAQDENLALAEIRVAQAIRPDWEIAALLEAQILQRESNAAATTKLHEFLKIDPKARESRMVLARMLVADKQYPEARAQFNVLQETFPSDVDVIFAVGILSIQLNDYASAEANLKRLLTLEYRDKDSIRLYLGQIAEDQKRYDAALAEYAVITGGEHFIVAQIRYANVLAKQNRFADALRHVQSIAARNNQQRVQLILAEVQLLRDANQSQSAFDLLARSLETLPNQPDLLYDYAMLAEKLDRVDILEANLRKLIALKPDHAHAYNALGYSLADRNVRLDEALQYIATALQLAPDDAFIIDSMGWVNYRLGHYEVSLKFMRRAYTVRPDPDIAAHLGEVLWIMGQQEEAKRVWQEASKKDPANEALLNTIKRFTP